ncbi:glycosyltransferase family 2 protein [Fundidesulfovibrio soli]|uniref:glycosyltransferase family 2 protein n=1 Tax=Fundidesulfovibrio soli TaxID=2922716 RepID=UPI001FAEDA49|nr:glycosyltransferase [Fundidesulfovibrio soli]
MTAGTTPFAQIPALPPALEDARLTNAGIAPPKVTVLVTSYNYAPYVLECLRSVARQTYPEWECVVVDDRSTDGSAEIIEAFAASEESRGRFRMVRRTENGGQMEAFKDGLALATGALVVLLDADDVLLEDFLEAHVRAHLGRRPVAFTSSNQYQIDGAGRVLSAEHLDHQSKGFYRLVSRTTFQRGFWVWATASSMMYRADVLRLILEHQPRTFRICADYYVAHFANLIGCSLLIPSIHGCYRRHGENNFGSNPVLGALNSVGCMSKHPPHPEFRKAIIEHVLANSARFLPILGGPGLRVLVWKVATLKAFGEVLRKRPDLFPGPAWKAWAGYLRFRISRWRRDRSPWPDKLEIIAPEEAEPGRPAP